MVETYSLLLAAMPSKDYSAGWLAGSMPAHLISCKLNKKVFWFAPTHLGNGVNEEDRPTFKELIDKISKNDVKVGDTYKGIKLDKYGYVYDGSLQKVLWRFRLERIFSDEDFRKVQQEYKKYLSFREVYLKNSKKDNKDSYWFLMSDIRKIVKPVPAEKYPKNKLIIPNLKIYVGSEECKLFTTNWEYGGVIFIHDPVPDSLKNAEKTNAGDEIDSYLKDFFLKKLPGKQLKERVIQQAFAINLMTKYNNNWTLVMEKRLKSKRRPDILFMDKDGTLIVVEIKRDEDDDSVPQLKRYINELKKEHPKIRGVIVCGKITDNLEKLAKKENFELIKYSISITF